MTILITGAAGFIGYHCAVRLLQDGNCVLGLDNLTPYYDPALKEARLAHLRSFSAFRFIKADIADHETMMALAAANPGIVGIIHLAAQAGVRYSLSAPMAFGASNLMGHLTMLEFARALPKLAHFVYASSSSVYGGNASLPFRVAQRADNPISLYAATKRANELMSHSYAHLYRIPVTGLRFFTVYGPFGRPDMALFLFTKAIMVGEPISVFNYGKMRRDFTYIDDVVSGILAVLERPPDASSAHAPAALYNIGGSQPENLLDFIAEIERGLAYYGVNTKAQMVFEPLQAGDVPETVADCAPLEEATGFVPKITISEGIPKFLAWYMGYYHPDVAARATARARDADMVGRG